MLTFLSSNRVALILAGFLIAQGFALPHAVARPQFFQLQKQKTLEAHLEGNYFSTEANYASSGGSYADLPNGGSYKNLHTQVGARYAFSPRIYVLGDVNLAKAESFDGHLTRTQSEITDLRVGGQYVFKMRPYKIATELILSYPMNIIDVMTDKAIASEGVFYVQPGAWLTRRWSSLEFLGYLGFKYQGDGRADLLISRAGGQFWMRRFFIGLGANGENTILKDATTDNATLRTAVTQRVNGRSLRYYAVNPNLIEADGWVGMRFSTNSQLLLGISQTINGKNTAEGMNIHASLKMTLVGGKLRSSSSPPKLESSFEVDSDDYDETLFQDLPPEPARKKPRPRPSSDETQMLDETMRELENQK